MTAASADAREVASPETIAFARLRLVVKIGHIGLKRMAGQRYVVPVIAGAIKGREVNEPAGRNAGIGR
ncbi:hypothetical protein [Variovorax sp. J22R115]|uniref:hypothetical protein n=1 Tax=Variovorax sp. J22R115 TaxID=3053509 RepID=UPI00257783DF|nr:hypothetical protein [Variovorax sp. J22R115]